MSGWTPVTEDTLKSKAPPKGWSLVPEPAKEHATQDKSTVGNYQGRPGGAVLNENQSPDQAGIRALEKSMGIPNQPSSLGDAYKQQLGTLSDATKNAFNEWQEGLQRETGGNIPRSLTAVLAGGMTPIEMIARGIEGIAGGVESGGKSIAEGVKRNDPRAMAAGAGELTGAIGQMIGGEKSGEAVSKIPASARAAREAVGTAIHDEEGNLKSGAKTGAKIAAGAAGAAVGGAVGHEYLGAAAGYKVGPSLMESIFPEPESAAEARTQAEMYQAKAEDLMRRGKEQEALDKKAAKELKGNATPFEGSPKNPSGTIVSPDSPPPDLKTTYQSYPRAQLYQMALKGDMDALRELVRNPAGYPLPPNAKFLLGDAGRTPWRNLDK